MTATLTFTLPEEAEEFRLASNAGALAAALQTIDQELRQLIKYGDISEELSARLTDIRLAIPRSILEGE
jgi:hypothetical protein